ncbi:MAG: hypothetical protein F6K30_00675 [Cyanothece sp. SIO2G6]|nr:hypothetical protein [Cyanothece sp. SIO2G6]
MTPNEEPLSPVENSSPDANVQDNPSEVASTVTTDAEKLAQPEPAFGWTAYAEQINGRFAMVGFVLLLILEAATGQTFLAWLGLR